MDDIYPTVNAGKQSCVAWNKRYRIRLLNPNVRQERSRGNLRPFLGPLELASTVFRVLSNTNLLVAMEASAAEFSELLSRKRGVLE